MKEHQLTVEPSSVRRVRKPGLDYDTIVFDASILADGFWETRRFHVAAPQLAALEDAVWHSEVET